MADNKKLLCAMMDYESGCAERIQHFIKVYEFAKLIGEMEGLNEDTRHILETAAILHDIGIKPALLKYGSDAGHLQEQEGILPASELLTELGYDTSVIERVTYLVGHHHTYTDVEGQDYQILLEADFLVNLYENHCDEAAIKSAYEKIFRTETGKRMCRVMFGMEEELFIN